MFKKIVPITLALCLIAFNSSAQDPKERQYLTPPVHPTHKDKPKVTGWAAERVTEHLNRGMLAAPTRDGKVYLGWRLLQNDAAGISFNVYRSIAGGEPVKLNAAPVQATTDFIDAQPATGKACAYWVRPVAAGKELEASGRALVKADDKATTAAYRSIKFQGDYTAQKVAVGDLNGDGAYDFVIKQPGSSIDPAGQPDRNGTTYKLEAYLNDGTFLWRKDLGPGIEPGIWYSPMVVYDFDGDGKAEVAVKTGPEDARGADGRVRGGPEYISILDGMTGQEIAKADWPPRDPRLGDYNRINRNQLGVAYLDGKTPCLLVARGTYKLMVVDAYEFHEKKLTKLWHWEGDDETPVIRSMGAHNMHAADVDGDGRDEVILGSVCLDDNGTALWSVGLGHPDKVFVSDIDPARPGLEVFYAVEQWHDDGTGVCLVDAKTGEFIWKLGKPTKHVGDGMVADIDPSLPGLECWAAEDSKGGSRDKYLFNAQGKPVGTMDDVPPCRNWAFWDGDLLRETIAGGGFAGFGGGFGGFGRGGFAMTSGTMAGRFGRGMRPTSGTLARGMERSGRTRSAAGSMRGRKGSGGVAGSGGVGMTSGTLSRRGGRGGFGGFGGFMRMPSSVVKYKGETLTQGIEGSVMMIADLMGDWREEIVTVVPGELRIYTTTIPAADRRACLMQDPIYRGDVTMRSQGYDQAPVTSYYLGVDPKDAAKYKPVIEGKGGKVTQSREGFQD